MKLKYKKLVNKAIVLGALAVFIVLVSLVQKTESVSEYVFARGIARAYAYVMGTIASWFPFSLFDVFVTAGILALLTCIGFLIYYLVRKKGIKAVALIERIFIAVLCVLCLYELTASSNYYRQRLPLEKYEGEQLSSEETAELYGILLDDFASVSRQIERDENGKSISPYSFDQINDLIHQEYARQMTDKYYNQLVPEAKQGWYSSFLTCEGICGITFMPTGDAVINSENPPCYNVVVTAHELAHASGVMREGDANLVAYSLLINSEIPYLRYCGYMYALSNLETVLYKQDKELYRAVRNAKYPPEAYKERYELEWKEWNEKNNFLEDIGEFFNDLYLKLNGAENGTESYSDNSTYHEVVNENTGEVVEVKVKYSDTARVLLQIAINKRG